MLVLVVLPPPNLLVDGHERELRGSGRPRQPVEAMFEDRVDMPVGARADGDGPGTGGLQAGVAIALGEPQDAEAGAVALLGVRPVGEDSLDEGGRVGADRARPGDEAQGRPLEVVLMRWGHVGGVGGVPAADLAADMGRHPLPAMEQFDRRHRQAGIDEFVHQLVGDGVVVAVQLDVVVDIHAGVVVPVAVPRVFEKVYAGVMTRAEAGPPLKKRIFHWAVGVGKQVSQLKQARKPVPAGLGFKYRVAEKLVFSKMQAALGGRLRFAVSGGAPLSREIAEFFHAAGILVLEGYGLTETCPSLTFNREDNFKFGSVGQAQPSVELKLASDGEILGRGPNIAMGYFKKPEATKEVFLPDGWFATGDIGKIDSEGFLYITDRKKDLIVTAGGINIAPQNVENLLKGDPFISQAMVHGDKRPYPVALITLNPAELAKFARDQGILLTDPAALAKHPKVLERVSRIIEERNAGLQSYAKIKKFAILSDDFTIDNGLLTPTLKVKRKIITDQHKELLDSLYR